MQVSHDAPEAYDAVRTGMGVDMRFRIVADNLGTAFGGIEPSAKEALSKLLEFERMGFRKISIFDEADRAVTREELVRRASDDRGALDG